LYNLKAVRERGKLMKNNMRCGAIAVHYISRQKGTRPPGDTRKGSPNKLTGAVRDMVPAALNERTRVEGDFRSRTAAASNSPTRARWRTAIIWIVAMPDYARCDPPDLKRAVINPADLRRQDLSEQRHVGDRVLLSLALQVLDTADLPAGRLPAMLPRQARLTSCPKPSVGFTPRADLSNQVIDESVSCCAAWKLRRKMLPNSRRRLSR
jgi:hypothetical protein